MGKSPKKSKEASLSHSTTLSTSNKTVVQSDHDDVLASSDYDYESLSTYFQCDPLQVKTDIEVYQQKGTLGKKFLCSFCFCAGKPELTSSASNHDTNDKKLSTQIGNQDNLEGPNNLKLLVARPNNFSPHQDLKLCQTNDESSYEYETGFEKGDGSSEDDPSNATTSANHSKSVRKKFPLTTKSPSRSPKKRKIIQTKMAGGNKRPPTPARRLTRSKSLTSLKSLPSSYLTSFHLSETSSTALQTTAPSTEEQSKSVTTNISFILENQFFNFQENETNKFDPKKCRKPIEGKKRQEKNVRTRQNIPVFVNYR